MLVILFIYFCFVCWLCNGSKNLVKKSNTKSVDYFISIVIAVRDEAHRINNLLNALKNQTFSNSNFEIIIVNDKSNDNTYSTLKSYTKDIKNLIVLNIDETPENWDSKMWALNKGILNAKGDIILHTDGDCIPGKKWVENIASEFGDINVGAVCGFTPLKGNDILALENIAQDAFYGLAIANNWIFSCNGRSFAYRKKYFLDIDGFNGFNYIVGGDDDLLLHKIVHKKRCKVKYLISKNAQVLSDTPNTIDQFISQRLRYAYKSIVFYKFSFSSIEVKLIMPLLFFVNCIVCFSIIKFCQNPNFKFLIIIILKVISDFILLSVFCSKIKFKFNYLNYILLSIFHPFYIIIFSIFAPFQKIKWK